MGLQILNKIMMDSTNGSHYGFCGKSVQQLAYSCFTTGLEYNQT